jgi:hypothetical protein
VSTVICACTKVISGGVVVVSMRKSPSGTGHQIIAVLCVHCVHLYLYLLIVVAFNHVCGSECIWV